MIERTLRARLPFLLTIACVLLVSLTPGKPLHAGGIPASEPLSYYGVLQNASGSPLEGEHQIGVDLWDDPAAGERLCGVGAQKLTTRVGRFSLALPDECTAAVSSTPDVWVAVSVDGSTLPRAKLGAVPYSVEAANASRAAVATVAEQASGATGALEQRIAALEARLATLESAPVPSVRGEWTTSAPTPLPPGAMTGSSAVANAPCPDGTRVIAGACNTQHGAYAVWLSDRVGNGWECRASPTRTTGDTPYGPLTASAFCAP